jgi:hypothetical protein
MTPTLDPSRLRELVASLPDAARATVGSMFTAEGWPKLTEQWEPEKLWGAALRMKETAEAAGFINWNWGPVWDFEPALARVRALPDDLSDMASENAKEAGVPSLRLADRWTAETWAALGQALAHAEGLAAKRHRHVMAALRGAGVDSDEARHEAIKIVTSGRTESSKMLTGPEARHLASWAETRAMIPDAPLTPFEVTDWKAEAKRLGTTLAELVNQAKAFCQLHQLPAVVGSGSKALESIREAGAHRVIAHLLGSADDGETIMECTAEHVATMAPPTVPEIVADAIERVTEQVTERVSEVGTEQAEHATTVVLEALRADHDDMRAALSEVQSTLALVLEMISENGKRAEAALSFVQKIEAPLDECLKTDGT